MNIVSWIWYKNGPLQKGIQLLLLPFSYIYYLLFNLHKKLFDFGFLVRQHSPLPLVVVGNLTAGGTGKTPLVIHIAEKLLQAGFHPGIVLRGYKGRYRNNFSWVTSESDPVKVGDEALMLAKRCACPVVVSKKRIKGIEVLHETQKVDVIISDDGLQHHAIIGDIEIAVIDGKRKFGNEYYLPAGPLRESPSRLEKVDLIVVNGGQLATTSEASEEALETSEGAYKESVYKKDRKNRSSYTMSVVPEGFRRIADTQASFPLSLFRDQTVHAVAGIGNPERFFESLKLLCNKVICHLFPDHHHFKPADIVFDDAFPVILTEKDAVKCSSFMNENHWVLQARVDINPNFDLKLFEMLRSLKHG